MNRRQIPVFKIKQIIHKADGEDAKNQSISEKFQQVYKATLEYLEFDDLKCLKWIYLKEYVNI